MSSIRKAITQSWDPCPDRILGGDDPPPRLSDVVRALRHPDVSIVIDLSAITHEEKLNYVNELLPMLTSLRRSVGLPHWIVVDEAHYFLHQLNERCIDFELAAYVMRTYQPSQLHPDLLKAIESIIVTPMTNPVEVHALSVLCGAEGTETEWGTILAGLGIDEAAVLSRFNGSSSLPRRFTITGRMTSHVRHRAKYLEVPMSEDRAFVFTCNGHPVRTTRAHLEGIRHPASATTGRSLGRSCASRRFFSLD